MINVKSKTNGIKIGILSLVGVAVLVVGALFLFKPGAAPAVPTNQIDINKYVDADFEKYNGYGSASFVVDYEAMISDATAVSGVSNNAKSEAEKMLQEMDVLKISFESSDRLSNDDTIAYTWEVNEELLATVEKTVKTDILTENGSIIVSGLYELEEVDPFEELQINTNQTSSGAGTVEFSTLVVVNGPDITWKVKHDGENGKIKNGDTLHLVIDENIDEDQLAKTHGLKIKRFEADHVVDYLCDFARDETIFDYIGKKDVVAMNKVIDDWVVTGLNDENLSFGDRKYEAVGYMFYTNNEPKPIEEVNADEQTDEAEVDTEEEQVEEFVPTESMLFAVYKITDQYVEGGYYVFIGHKGIISFDHTGLYTTDGEEWPNSFIDYEKETIRYSPKFGWGQNYEPMGFLHDGLGYAGHRDINETFNYVTDKYGHEYTHRYVSPELAEMLN